MTGLDKIVSRIAKESAQNCAAVLEEANSTASQIISEARNASAKEAEAIISSANEQAQRIISVAKSSAESVTRTKYLEVRNAVINDIISAAYEEIAKLSDEEYFDLLYRLCLKNTETGECMLYLSERDLKRLPKDFEARINQAVYEKGAVQISKTPMDIDDGFILDYGDFEINCTVKSVFDDNMEMLKDLLCNELF